MGKVSVEVPKDFQILEFTSPRHPLTTIKLIVPKSWGDGYAIKQALHVLHHEHHKFYAEDFKP